MSKWKKAVLVLAACAACFGIGVMANPKLHTQKNTATGYHWTKWTENSPAIDELEAYVKKTTTVGSPDFIPVERRIVVSDLDGTLFCEQFPAYTEWLMFINRALNDPTYDAPEEIQELAVRIQEEIDAGNQWSEDTEMLQANLGAKAFAGMSIEEYDQYCENFLQTQAAGFRNLKRGDAFYQPMLEMIDYLQQNDFKVYVCSGTDRFFVRKTVDGVIDISPDQVIGTDVLMEATNQNGEDGLEYVYDAAADEVVRGDELIMKNVKANKVSQIAQEIYYQPVMALGNSSGDTSMLRYVLDDNEYPAMSMFVLCDDVEREYGNLEKAASYKTLCEENGWTPISMADDFLTIYGEDVTITGDKGK